MRKAVFALALVFLLPAWVLAAETVAVSEHPEAISARVVESDVQRTVLEYDIGSFTKSPVDIDGETFYSVELGSESPSKERGLPQLPNICRSIVIPDDAEMAVRVVSSHYIDYPNTPVAPSKGSIPRNIDPATVAYTFDAFYGSDEWYPVELAHARDPYIMRDMRGMVVVINPLQYNPATQTLRVYDRVVVEVEQIGPGKMNVLTALPAVLNTEFKKIYERHFINFDSTDLGRYPPVEDGGNMLVICYDDPGFLAAMQPLVEWKNQMGVPCEMVTTTDAGGSAAAFDAYIEQYYNDHGLTYVLLVGDAAQCPSLEAHGGSSDPSFTLITPGDVYADLFVGRFSAQTVAQVQTQVLRTIEYEKRPQAGADWYHKGMGVASNQGPGDDGEYDDEHIDNIRADLLAFTYTEVDQIYDPTGTATMVTDGLNDGRSVINYCGHGSTTSWGSTGFSDTHVNALVNDNMLPFIVSVACLNGQFDGYTCFAEAWLRATNGAEPTGAIATYMSSILQDWDEPMDAQDEIADLLVGTSTEGVRRTFGGMCFNGGGHMLDEYGTYGEDDFLTWHIFGDPSLRVRTDTPAPVTVNHITVIYPSTTTFDVEVVGVEGALCALYGDGVLYGSALTDATGNATVPIGSMPPVGEMLTLTVTGFNTETYTSDIPVIVPVTYDISPPTIPVNMTTSVTITVWDSEGLPLPDVEIVVDGWGIEPHVDVTDVSGEAHLTIMPPYGEDLTVVASEIGEPYNCFEDVIPVTGASTFSSADIEASVASIGLYGSLTPHYEGTITGTASESGLMLFAVGCGVDASAGPSGGTTQDLFVTPTSTGTIAAAIGKTGYNVYLEGISVDVVYGQLAGGVYDAMSAPIVGAVVKGYPAGSDTTGATPLFQDVSDALGAYDMGLDIEVGYYDVYVSKFGYLTVSPEIFIQYGANAEDFYLDSAPSGVVSGTVTGTGTDLSLEATVKVYRSDNMELYAETTSDPGTGYYEVTLPYFNYEMNVRAYHHIPENRGISVSTPSMTEDFVLDETLANILVISDGVAARSEAFKVDKAGNVIDTWSGDSDLGRSAGQISADLVTLGYDVTEEAAATTDPGTWLMNYDFILWSSGDNESPVADGVHRTALENYVAGGGKLLIEGGEIAYDALQYPGYPTFAANVLHSVSWISDLGGNLTVYDPTHPVTNFPNTIGTIAFSYANYGDCDASVPTADASMVTSWTSYPSDASIIVYDDNPNPMSGQIVFFQFDYLAGEASGVMALLENAVTYLMAQEGTPDGSISGTVTLEGETNHSGITVTAYPGGASVVTDVSGGYVLEGLYDATYRVEATKPDWSTGVVEGVVVSGGGMTTGVDMMLYPVTTVEHCNSPALAIPDSYPAGVYDTITFAEDMDITDVEVYINITHTWINDLIVEVTSPEGTTVRLHNRSGGSADNIVGWYDSELTVDGPGALTDFVGESTLGDWTLWVSDNAGADVGVVNEWCVQTLGGAPTGVDDELDTPVTYVLRGVSPNPFNPVTTVAYGVPSDAHVRLVVYNVAGRHVRTLVDGEVDPGYHVAVWDGRDDRGVEVGSGVYFCRMEADGFDDTTKMVLLK